MITQNNDHGHTQHNGHEGHTQWSHTMQYGTMITHSIMVTTVTHNGRTQRSHTIQYGTMITQSNVHGHTQHNGHKGHTQWPHTTVTHNTV